MKEDRIHKKVLKHETKRKTPEKRLSSRREYQVRKSVTQKEGRTLEEAAQELWRDNYLVVYYPHTVMCLRKKGKRNRLKQESLSNPPRSSYWSKETQALHDKTVVAHTFPLTGTFGKKNYKWHVNIHDKASVAISSNTLSICTHMLIRYLYSNEILNTVIATSNQL